MKIRPYFKTFSFRAGILLFLATSTTIISLRLFTYYESIGNAYEGIKLIVTAHIEEINEGVERYGVQYARNMVEAVANETHDVHLYIAFKKNSVITGNVDEWPKAIGVDKEGWSEAYIKDHEDPNTPSHVYFKTLTYPGKSVLLVGYDLQRVDLIRRNLLRILIENFILSMVVSFALSLGLVWLLNRHILNINKACESVMQGNLNYRINVNSDTDEFDRLANNLNKMLDWINTLIETVKDSSNALAHDMRTPLSRHKLELRALSENPKLPKELKGSVTSAAIHIDTLVEMFDNILNIAKAESRSSTELFEPFDIAELVRDVLDFYDILFVDKELSRVEEIPEESIKFLGDKQLVSQALVNLIDNAIKYTQQNGEIKVLLNNSSAGEIRIEVADNGPGVPPEFIERVKERFFRAEKSRNTQGTGLGLSLVNAVAKLHHGEFMLEDNNPGLKAILVLRYNIG